jgi:putative transposase
VPFIPDKHHRRSTRLNGWDYTSPGAYFVTLCVHERVQLFGKIVDGKMRLNELGQYVQEYWCEIPAHFAHAQLDEYVIMPNHLHGIIHLRDASAMFVGANNHSPLQKQQTSQQTFPKCGTSRTIGSIIRGFKIGVTKCVRDKTSGAVVWQRNYYDHISRDEKELFRFRQYIRRNPANWDSDEQNPLCKSPRFVAMSNAQRCYL